MAKGRPPKPLDPGRLAFDKAMGASKAAQAAGQNIHPRTLDRKTKPPDPPPPPSP